MKERLFREVYDTLLGMIRRDAIAGIENAFEEGSFCQRRYAEMLDAYGRLCDRLGTVDDDEDVEEVIGALLDIQKVLCQKMFEYGIQFGVEVMKTGK